MRKVLFVILTLSFLCLNAKDNITIYNDEFALIRSQFDIQLEKGVQNYIYDNIPSQIETNSLVFKNQDNKLMLISQNYEYDLAGTNAILNKYLNKQIDITMRDKSRYSGTLTFFVGDSYGIQDNETKEMHLINKSEIMYINLPELPGNFYIKPSLKWQIDAPKAGQYPLDISYITKAIDWFVTYNVVLNPDKMEVSPWVTIDNQSGKSYKDVSLKLMAGDLNKEEYEYEEGIEEICTIKKSVMKDPAFEEKAFADYHLYTLDQNVSINENQIKQMALFDTKTVDYERFYDYTSFNEEVISKVKFKNSEQNGLGLPLPKGIVMMYLKDKNDNLVFVDEDDIAHTALDQEVELSRGNTFDVSAKTTLIKSTQFNHGADYELSIVIENNKNEDIELRIQHIFYYDNTQIISKNFDYTEKDAYSIYINRKIKAGTTDSLFWTQREKYN